MSRNTHGTIVSIHFGHNATVALLEDGEIKYCISEERFNRIKNSTGFPKKALEFIKNKAKNPIDYYVITQKYPWGYQGLKNTYKESKAYSDAQTNNIPKTPWQIKLMPNIFYKRVKNKMLSSIKEIEKKVELKSEMEDYFTSLLQTEKDKIIFADHHLTHALSLKFFERDESKKLVFTLDGEGDGLCGTITIVEKNKYEVISRINKAFSLGYLYREITAFLGMKPDEHEFKVMGLAPYAKENYVKSLLSFFKKILWINKNDEFESDIPMPYIRYYLMEKLIYKRFDNIAGAVQMFTEEIVTDWIKRWINKTNIKNIGISGGVFMNVKLNQKITEMKEVETLTLVPSAGDESTVIGGCYLGYEKYCRDKKIDCKVQKLNNLYLGNEYTDEEIEKFLKENNYYNKYKISKPENIENKVAELLANNEVVARFSGRMEFGARALGNRSILANPSSYENVRIINEMIKNRDFWMPFATSVLEESSDIYLKNPKKVDADFMVITFNTHAKAHKDLTGAIHPYDKTSRPQVVKKEVNPEYHSLISKFEELTGIGGILNTSFNLHGEPNVESPKDAIHTLEDSGLKYLALGSYLISK